MAGILQGVLASIGGAPANYIEDVFSTYLYSGTGANQTITNGIDLSGKGGLVWTKNRTSTFSHVLIDTVRGGTGACVLRSNSSSGAISGNQTNLITPFNSNGYTIATDWSELNDGTAGSNYCSWTFREQAKFFDIVTYTGDGTESRSISHNLGSVPGMIIIKSTSNAADWTVYHRSSPGNLRLNTTAANTGGNFNISGDSTSTNIVLGTNTTGVNVSSQTYVAYLFAHNAGGFGTAGTDNVISCGSYTGNGSATGPVINLGYEPQYLMIKASSLAANWFVFDNMRGIPTGGSDPYLLPNSSAAEADGLGDAVDLNATGFQLKTASGQLNSSGDTYIYMAIRRPMKVPTTGASVFNPVTLAGNSTGFYNATINPDLTFAKFQAGVQNWWWVDRLRGNNPTLNSDSTAAEVSNPGLLTLAGQPNNIVTTAFANGNANATWNFKRAAGFMDVVCYTGTGSTRTVAHNLTVVPEMMIVKQRSGANNWQVYHSATGADYATQLNLTNAVAISNVWGSGTPPTSTVFTVSGAETVNDTGSTYVAYLFATCLGVSKVGSYTGTGATLNISCGFTGGARFVLIKRTDSTGSWWVWDTARGMVTSTDPRLALNSTAAELNNDWVFTITGGFSIVTSDATVNASGGSYIFLAIA